MRIFFVAVLIARIFRLNRLIIAIVTVFGLLGPVAEPLRGDVTAEQVRDAIDRGVGYLLAQQRNDGSWPDYGDYSGGGQCAMYACPAQRRRGDG